MAALEEDLKKARKEKPAPTETIQALEAKIAAIRTSTPLYDTPLVGAVVDEALEVVLAGDDPQSGTKLAWRPGAQDLPVHVRGNPNRPGRIVPRRFLAAGFVEHDWSLKWLHRQIVASSTWRQSSRFDPAAASRRRCSCCTTSGAGASRGAQARDHDTAPGTLHAQQSVPLGPCAS